MPHWLEEFWVLFVKTEQIMLWIQKTGGKN